MDGFDRLNMTIPLTIYGGEGISRVVHVYMGQHGSYGSIQLLNGFEPGGFWNVTNELTEYSWDGNLPDGICFRGAADAGFGFPDGSGLASRIVLYMQIDNDDTSLLPTQFCIDSTGFGEPHEWLFDPPSPSFDGPYCWNVKNCQHWPPAFNDCPSTPLVARHDALYTLTLSAWGINVGDMEFYLISGPGSIIDQWEGWDEGYMRWAYDPDISEAGDTINIIFDVCDVMYQTPPCMIPCDVTLIIASACGDINGDMNINILDVSTIIDYLYKDGPSPNYYYHADVDLSDNINVLDATYLINYLYKSGPEPICRRIRDDFPASPDCWWKYERYDGLTAQYDTIIVNMTDRSTRTLTFSDTTLTQTVDIRADTVLCAGVYPDAMSIFPLSVGSNWMNESINSADTVISMSVASVPAGAFTETYQIRRRWSCGENCLAVHNEWFVLGAGAVRFSMQQYDSVEGTQIDEMWELIEFSIE
jgi:hypothetical protein